jgi:hypothetical protein
LDREENARVGIVLRAVAATPSTTGVFEIGSTRGVRSKAVRAAGTGADKALTSSRTHTRH